MAQAIVPIRERVQAASSRIRRVKRLDRLATAFITLGGVFIIVSVSFIFLFIFGETWPLFRPAAGRSLGALPLATPPAPAHEVHGKPLVFGTDEYQMYLYQLTGDGRLSFFKAQGGQFARGFDLPALGGATVSAASRSVQHDFVAAGTSDGRVLLSQVFFRPKYEHDALADLEIDLRERGTFEVDPKHQPVRAVVYDEREGRQLVAAELASGAIAVVRAGEDQAPVQATLHVEPSEAIRHLALVRADAVVAATDRGFLYYWELDPEPRLLNRNPVASAPITALGLALGGSSILVGDQSGAVSAWTRVRVHEEDTDLALVRTHVFAPQSSAVLTLATSPRDKSFATAGADGSLWLRHVTSERTLLRFPPTRDVLQRLLITPKLDGILGQREDGVLKRYEINDPHPEFSWSALFGKVWYEGYPKPEYVWQSTGGTDDFEAKFSLIPLIFGTLKGTFYALLFAVPIAILSALYASQFMHPSLKAKVKPAVEIMAALPSVVVGFVAGLWLASRVEERVVPVLLMVVALPLFGTAGMLFWDRLPRGLRRRLKPGMEIFLIVPLLVVGGLAAGWVGPWLESLMFGGDFKQWLNQSLQLVYDQRNCLVVGIAMGFAVIPIIFTISEDAFSSVPPHLTAASLALGASRWQTAVRVVLPTASPGLFSAVMIGFGRAVGETMIVLMATGNTPVLDFSIFNGMRTLAANIAVEIPEAPHGGTLYRTLFLAGGVLFIMTFVVNTLAELVRQRLRERYKAI